MSVHLNGLLIRFVCALKICFERLVYYRIYGLRDAPSLNFLESLARWTLLIAREAVIGYSGGMVVQQAAARKSAAVEQSEAAYSGT